MAKNKNRENKKKAAAQPAADRFPGWLAWTAFCVWGFIVLRSYFSVFTPDLHSIFVILSPQQYSLGGFKIVLEHISNIAVALAFMFANFALGRLALRLSGFRFLNALEETVFSAGLGMGLLSVFVFLLGIFKLLYFRAVAVPLGLLFVAGIYDLFRHPLPKTEPFHPSPGLGDLAAMSILFFAMAINLLGALAPEIFYDSLIYHLAVPNFYAIQHKITLMPYNAFSNLPLTHGMLYLSALLIKGVSLAKLVNYSALTLTAAAAVGIGVRYFSWRPGLWAALIFYTVFHTMVSAWSAGTEILLTFFSILAIYSVMVHNTTVNNARIGENSGAPLPSEPAGPQAEQAPHFFQTGQSAGRAAGKRWLWLAAVFSGLSMGVKYTGLFTAFGVMLVYAFNERKNISAAVKDLAIFTLIASLFIGPWLVKNYAYTGNPVYPAMTDVFKSDSYTDPAKLKKFLGESRQMGKFKITEWAAAPWNATMGKTANSEYFTPLFIFLLPLCFLLAAPAGAPLLSLWLFFLAVWLTWSGSSTMVRFLMPAYPAAGLIISAYLFSGTHRALKAALKAVVLLLCLTGLYWSTLVFYSQGRWKPVFGQVTKDDYLSHTQPTYPYSHYAGIKYINEKLPPDSKTLIVGDGRSLYLEKNFMISTAFDKTPLVEYAMASGSGAELYARMKAEGLTHILLNVAEGVRLARDYGMFYFDARTLAVFNDFWAAHVKEVYSYDEVQGGRPINKIEVYELVDNREPVSAPPFNYMSEVIMKGR
ncbi:MAG: hypothetical protein NTX59_05810 [Elusimicrobia bacterium]|nr:hypothetical protein [Elusimicrobiota bacterium]